ncbi:LUD domain-containing protein [Actinomadura viridis]|uniref:L-lactate dehydrogenase complex protein LldG n=1 Tax=Actinomadura viridis TaxID=58110 RepID=A0A931GKT0_9ACTN|nr:LUD domain-containing protein [Actinomadura viridis]MBG6090692.1 L-lactate dehydrogenase complex protein LldG [Actinomadura viridis]
MSARDDILGRIDRIAPPRDAAGIAASYAAIDRSYLRRHHEDGILDLFAERVADYRAGVRRVTSGELPGAVAAALAARPGTHAVPGGLPAAWLADADPVLLTRDPAVADLDGLAGAVTGCAAAIAETGTIVLDHGPGQGPRALSLVPDYHLIVVTAEQVAADVPEALERLDPRRPLTFVSGPSATSDIELSRVEGVHGPRTLEVLLVS